MEEAKKLEFEVVSATAGEDRVRLQIGAWCDELDDGWPCNIPLKRYDEAANAWVEDSAVFDKADGLVREAFGGVGVEQVISDMSSVMGARFEGYLTEDGRVFLTPPPVFVDFEPVDEDAAAAILAAYGEGGGVTTPMREVQRHGIGRNSGEPYSMYQFEAGVAVPTDDGERYFRISQFARPSEAGGKGMTVGLRFDDRFASMQYALSDTGQFGDDPDSELKALKIADKAVAKRRKEVVARFEAVTGRDIDGLVESGYGIEFDHLEVGTVAESGSHFVICHLAGGDAVAVSEPEGADFDDDDDIPF